MHSHLKTIKVLGEVDVSYYVDLFSAIDDADWMGEFNKASQKFLPFFREIDRLPVLYAYKVDPALHGLTIEDLNADASEETLAKFMNPDYKNDVMFKGKNHDKYFNETLYDNISKALTETIGKGQITMWVFNLMNAKTKIDKHTDVRTDNKKRIHIPIITHPDIILYNSGDEIHMEVGKVYMIDHYKEHSVVNPTDCERIHLVIDWKIDD